MGENDIRQESYGNTDFKGWLKVGEKFEVEFKDFMAERNINIIKNEDRRVDYRTSDKSLNKYYEVKEISTFPKPWLIEKVHCNFPICLDYKKLKYYEAFLKENPDANFKMIFKLDYPKNVPQSKNNGWYWIEVKKLVKLFQSKPEREFTRQLRLDEEKSGRENARKWHLDFSELTHKII